MSFWNPIRPYTVTYSFLWILRTDYYKFLEIRRPSFAAAGTFNAKHERIKYKHPPTNQSINVNHRRKHKHTYTCVTHTHTYDHTLGMRLRTFVIKYASTFSQNPHVCERRKDRNVCLRQHHDHHLRFYFVTGAFGDRLMYWDRQYSRKRYDGGYTIKTSLCV